MFRKDQRWCVQWIVFVCIAMAGCVSIPAQAQSAKSVTYYYTDPQGSVLATADADGNLNGSTDYRPFGQQTTEFSESSPGYTGHVLDSDSGLVYAQQRYYDADTGRFLSVDPVGVGQKDGRDLNRYWYGNNNPYRYTDPDGREVTCTQDTCTAVSHSLLELAVDSSTLAALYTKRLIENALQPSDIAQKQTSEENSPVAKPEPGTAESEEGCIYCVDGVNTESGKDYVGSSDDLGRRTATAKDGRDRTNATKVDKYKKGDRTDRQNKEQKAINERGGRDYLDNKRNEVAPDKWKDRGIPPSPNG